MATIDLNQLRTFLDVHQTGSFSLAAAKAGVPRSTVSRAVASLERSLGVRLLHRTTRRVSTTAAGEALAQRATAPLTALEGSLESLPERGAEPSGLLRVTSTVDIGTTLLVDAVRRFTARWPTVEVELHLTNELVDLVGRGFDLAVRALARPARDSSLVARKVGRLALGLYASPAYLARRGTPRREEDLAHHEGVRFGRDRRMVPSLAGARVAADDMLVTREMLRAGVGIGMLPSFLAEPDVATGALARVLPRWDLREGHVYVVVPSQRQLAPKVRAFRELLIELLRQWPLAREG